MDKVRAIGIEIRMMAGIQTTQIAKPSLTVSSRDIVGFCGRLGTLRVSRLVPSNLPCFSCANVAGVAAKQSGRNKRAPLAWNRIVCSYNAPS